MAITMAHIHAWRRLINHPIEAEKQIPKLKFLESEKPIAVFFLGEGEQL